MLARLEAGIEELVVLWRAFVGIGHAEGPDIRCVVRSRCGRCPDAGPRCGFFRQAACLRCQHLHKGIGNRRRDIRRTHEYALWRHARIIVKQRVCLAVHRYAGTLERDTRKQATVSGVRNNLCLKRDIGRRAGLSSNWPGRDRCVRAERQFAVGNAVNACTRLENQDDIRRLPGWMFSFV